MHSPDLVSGRPALNALVGFGVGIAGGLIGLGGAELRLPYLVGVLGLTAHIAVPVNLAISLATILAAIPARLLALREIELLPHLTETIAIAAGAVLAAWFGAGWLARISGSILNRLIFILMLLLGLGLLLEAGLAHQAAGFIPDLAIVKVVAGALFGTVIGGVSSLLGVAGGELIIPTLVLGYGVSIKAAGSLAMMISLPTVAAGIIRHLRLGTFADAALLKSVVAPMAAGSILGAFCGGLLIGFVPEAPIKIALGILLIWSAWKVFAEH